MFSEFRMGIYCYINTCSLFIVIDTYNQPNEFMRTLLNLHVCMKPILLTRSQVVTGLNSKPHQLLMLQQHRTCCWLQSFLWVQTLKQPCGWTKACQSFLWDQCQGVPGFSAIADIYFFIHRFLGACDVSYLHQCCSCVRCIILHLFLLDYLDLRQS